MRTVLILLAILMIAVPVQAAEVGFSWTPPTVNCDGSALTDLAGYIVKCGDTPSGPYTQECVVNDPTATSYICTLEGVEGETAYCAVVAFDEAGNRSDDPDGCGPIEEVAYPFPATVPAPPTGVTVQ